jgi:hypothetical protein
MRVLSGMLLLGVLCMVGYQVLDHAERRSHAELAKATHKRRTRP